ncbi:MAG: RDD family protein [Candidatus Bathyarchaeia archaeon]
MPYCPRCGREVSEGAHFCPNCGADLTGRIRESWGSETGFGLLASDWRVQSHWLRRVIAYVIDSVLVLIFTGVIFLILSFPFLIGSPWSWWGGWRTLFGFPSLAWVVYLLYFTLMEGIYGYTFGKRVMGLEVVMVGGAPLNLTKAFLRNLSKVFWGFLLLDVILGLASRGDPRQRFMDQVAETTVVVSRNLGWWRTDFFD